MQGCAPGLMWSRERRKISMFILALKKKITRNSQKKLRRLGVRGVTIKMAAYWHAPWWASGRAPACLPRRFVPEGRHSLHSSGLCGPICHWVEQSGPVVYMWLQVGPKYSFSPCKYQSHLPEAATRPFSIRRSVLRINESSSVEIQRSLGGTIEFQDTILSILPLKYFLLVLLWNISDLQEVKYHPTPSLMYKILPVELWSLWSVLWL